MDLMSSADLRPPASAKRRRRASPTTIDALGDDALCLIFSFLDLVHLIRCSVVFKPWRTVINKLKLLQIQYHRQRQTDSPSVSDLSNYSDKMINLQLEQLAVDRQRSSLQEGPANIFQWKAHSVGFNKCRMKMGLVLTGVGDKMQGRVKETTKESMLAMRNWMESILLKEYAGNEKEKRYMLMCLNPSSFSLFAGSSTGYASCWDLRTLRRRWETRVSPNVLNIGCLWNGLENSGSGKWACTVDMQSWRIAPYQIVRLRKRKE